MTSAYGLSGEVLTTSAIISRKTSNHTTSREAEKGATSFPGCDMEKNTSTQQRSVKSRYIILSGVISLILVASTLVTSFYVDKVTGNHADAMQRRGSTTLIISQVRESLWNANATLNTLLMAPHADAQQLLERHMNAAISQAKRLQAIATSDETDLLAPATALLRDLDALKYELLELMTLSQDPNWVFPVQPFIDEILLESNVEFQTATSLALEETLNNDSSPYAFELYIRLAKLRNAWQQQILSFRAVIILIASHRGENKTAQEQNITLYHDEVLLTLKELEKMQANGKLGIENEEALAVMQYRADKWYEDYQQLQKIRGNNIWRADVHYINQFIQPRQQAVERSLTRLDQAMLARSAHNAARMEQTATTINLELWGFTVISLAFVALVYFMLSRSVLAPIARIAEAMSSEEGRSEQLPMPTQSSKEIYSLVNAFNAMRHQIHHRQLALEHQALHDALTGLPNRALLHDRLQQIIPLTLRHGRQATLFLLDLDRFKEINDSLGHGAGDQVLQIIAQRLQACFRKADTVARLGGDEFAIVCPDVDNEQIRTLLDKAVEQVNQAIKVDKQNVYVGASIGVALCPEDGTDAHTLIQHADIAMYSAKRGRRHYAFFDASMNRMDVDNLALLGDLQQELQQPTGQFQIHYQPQIRLSDQHILGAEALLRWQHPRQGAISPEQVIHMAEHAGLIGELTTWVLAQAIYDAASWQHKQMPLRMSINLSAWNLQDPKLPQLIRDLLSQNGFTARLLTLEITESAVMEDPIRARQVLDELSLMGVSLAIDDYGTGLSSLAYLKMLPVNELKIDKSFVIDMLANENDAIIVQSTIELAHNLNLRVVAEGVEQAEIQACLQQGGCDSAQGFYIAQPMPESEFRQWYRKHNASKETHGY